MKFPDEIENLKELYIISAVQHGHASINGNYKMANKEFDRLKKIFLKVQESSEKCTDFFSSSKC